MDDKIFLPLFERGRLNYVILYLMQYFHIKMRLSMRLLFMSVGVLPLAAHHQKAEKTLLTPNQKKVNPACADYRTGYPEGPYGYSVGSILEDFPSMVDGSGTTQSLAQFHQDTSKTVLVILTHLIRDRLVEQRRGFWKIFSDIS